MLRPAVAATLALTVGAVGATTARADAWLDLAPVPDTSTLEPAFQLDRYIVHDGWCGYHRWGTRHSLGLGVAPHRGGSEAAAELVYAGGTGGDGSLLAFSTQTTAVGPEIRGRHEGRLELGTLDGGPPLTVALDGVVEHGPARGLAPIWLGHGRLITADGRADASVVLDRDGDLAWLAGIEASAGGTWWADGTIDHAARRGAGAHLSIAPIDAHIPRGAIDIVRARVEQATLTRAIATRGAAIGGTATVRTIELGTGFRDLTYHVNREFLAVLVADAGVVWLDSEAPEATTRGAMVRAQIGATVKSVHGRLNDFTTRRFGLGFAREPGYTPDGRTLTSDARVTALASIETPLISVSASGGISSVTPISGDVPDARSVVRYGGDVESFVPLGNGFELGARASATLEPRSNDPWMTAPTWAYEGTALLRWRGGDP